MAATKIFSSPINKNVLHLLSRGTFRVSQRTISTQQRLYSNSESETLPNEESSVPFSDEEVADFLAESHVRLTDAQIDPGSVYAKYPNAHPAPVGKDPKLRFFWEEKEWENGFPETPEEAGTDLLNFLEQRDVYKRRQVIHIPEFCVGSIVAVTRADQYSPKGFSRFVGICILKSFWQNKLNATFTLRNVIMGEPMEIEFQTYNPLIQSVEVLRHQKWKEHEETLEFLRDYPPRFSTIDENMEAEPYTEEPSVFEMGQRDKDRVRKWFAMIYESRRRR